MIEYFPYYVFGFLISFLKNHEPAMGKYKYHRQIYFLIYL